VSRRGTDATWVSQSQCRVLLRTPQCTAEPFPCRTSDAGFVGIERLQMSTIHREVRETIGA
jgi:hypothetical protein